MTFITKVVSNRTNLDDKTLVCGKCKKEVETLFTIKVLGIGQKEVCPTCYIKLLPSSGGIR